MTRIVKANIWKLDGVPVIPINTQGYHKKGLAKEAYDRKLIRYKLDNCLRFTGEAVCFPTKVIWTDKVDLELVKESFKRFTMFAKNTVGLTFNLPLSELVQGQGNYKQVLPLVVDLLWETDNVRLVLSEEDKYLKDNEKYIDFMRKYLNERYK